ncbi:hypothetical protein LT493_19820 [Streptomyces tricolor]|nr:hypothetical protein [Streptomyces tricolor]
MVQDGRPGTGWRGVRAGLAVVATGAAAGLAVEFHILGWTSIPGGSCGGRYRPCPRRHHTHAHPGVRADLRRLDRPPPHHRQIHRPAPRQGPARRPRRGGRAARAVARTAGVPVDARTGARPRLAGRPRPAVERAGRGGVDRGRARLDRGPGARGRAGRLRRPRRRPPLDAAGARARVGVRDERGASPTASAWSPSPATRSPATPCGASTPAPAGSCGSGRTRASPGSPPAATACSRPTGTRRSR